MKSILILLALFPGCISAGTESQERDSTLEAALSMEIQAQTVNQVVDRAMRWLDQHPASVYNNELMEVVEEIMFFYALYSIPEYKAERSYFLREITTRDEAIKSYLVETGDFRLHLNGDWAALTYPPLMHIISEVGLETDAYRVLVDELISHKRHLASPRNAMRLWIAIYLARQGLVSDSSVQYLLDNSSLQQDPKSHVLLDYFTNPEAADRDKHATIQLVYNITHEIIALTDFGALPPPRIMLAQRTHYARLIDAAMRWAKNESALDVLAELVFCAHLLDLGELPSLSDAVPLIISKQQENGSFGITNPDRPNGVRHGVLTSLLALKTLSVSKRAVGSM